MSDLVKARDDAVRQLANHLQPTQCDGCETCAVLWAAVAKAEHKIELAKVAA